MATRVTTTLVDDVDGTEAQETVAFGLDGSEFEIDLSDSNANNGPATQAQVFNAPEPQAIQTPPGTASTEAQAPEDSGPAAPGMAPGTAR